MNLGYSGLTSSSISISPGADREGAAAAAADTTMTMLDSINIITIDRMFGGKRQSAMVGEKTWSAFPACMWCCMSPPKP